MEQNERETDLRPLRVAVVGAGPAGVYASDILLRQLAEKGPELGIGEDASIDLFEKLPVPFGLVRYGVAPDHPAIKWIMGALEKTIDNPRMRLFCGVEVGKAVALDDLLRRYDAVLFATGAMDDRRLAIRGADLPQVVGAAEFVKWYDGYPGAAVPGLSATSVAVIGGGNVAMDVSRLLVKNPDDLLSTDIPDAVLAGLKANRLTDLHLFVRRGPAQAKFSVQELRELEKLRGVRLMVDAADFDLDEATRVVAGENKLTRQMLEELEAIKVLADDMDVKSEAAGHDVDINGDPALRRYHFHFFARPLAVLADWMGAVSGLRVERTTVSADGAMSGTGSTRDIPVQAVYHAIGYLPAHAAGAPYDEETSTLRNRGGRVFTDAGEPMPRVYVTGWAKRGPVGLIGSTKADAAETIANLLQDCAAAPRGGRADIDADQDSIVKLLRARGVAFTGLDGWKRLDAYERRQGESVGRERVKVVDAERMRRISAGW